MANGIPETSGWTPGYTTPLPVGKGDLYVSVKDLGASFGGYVKGDGVTDDTAAIQAAINNLPSNATLFFPGGTYLCNSSLTIPNYLQLKGVGKSSKIVYTGTGTFISLVNQREMKCHDLWFHATGTTGVLFYLSNSFRCSWYSCYLDGMFAGPANTGSYLAQTGVVLTANTGDCMFYDCDIANFGIGLKTDCIQNGVQGGKFGSNNTGIYGFGGGGMSLTGYVVFVSSPGITDTHLNIDGAQGKWWLTDVWIEGCLTAVRIGSNTAGSIAGPSQFGMVNCKIAATNQVLDIRCARMPEFYSVQLAADGGGTATPTLITIDPVNAPVGVAYLDNTYGTLNTLGGGQFPLGWLVHVKGGNTANFKVPDTLDIPYGSVIRMARSDNAYIQALQMQGGPRLAIKGPSSSAAGVLHFTDSADVGLLDLDATPGGVNQVAIASAVTATPPVIAVRGTDTNVDLRLQPKGTGGVQLGTAARLFAGAGVPTMPAVAGDVYFRTDTPTVTNQRLYIATAVNTWTGVL